MKSFGWFLILISASIIFYNLELVKNNEREMKEHPYKTIFLGGSNLKQAYTFTSPYTDFEIGVIVTGVVGLFLAFSGDSKKREDDE